MLQRAHALGLASAASKCFPLPSTHSSAMAMAANPLANKIRIPIYFISIFPKAIVIDGWQVMGCFPLGAWKLEEILKINYCRKAVGC